MVQGIEVVKIDVVFFSYNPFVGINNPIIKREGVCVAGSYELKIHRDYKSKQKNEMGIDAYKHYKWYSLVLKTELSMADYNSKLKIIHWHIESSNPETYLLDGKLYKAISLIYGPAKVYWYYANTGKYATYRFGYNFQEMSETLKTTSRIEKAADETKSQVHLSMCAGNIEREFTKIVEESETDVLKDDGNDIIVYTYPIIANGSKYQYTPYQYSSS